MRTGTRDVARNGISFPSAEVREVDSLSEDLQGLKNRSVFEITTVAAVSDWLIGQEQPRYCETANGRLRATQHK